MKVKLAKIAASDRWYATWAVSGRSFRQSMKTNDRRVAEARAAALRFSMIEESDTDESHFRKMASAKFARSLLARLQRVAKCGHDRRQVRLTEKQLAKLLRDSQGKCAISGVPLSFINSSGCPRNPWAPSVDRIDSGKSYRMGNVRIVCVAANTAMSDWGAGVLIRLAQAVVSQHGLRANRAQIDPLTEGAEVA